jgi:hypothetical protein
MNNETVRKSLQQTLEDLKTLRDEIRVNLHLAGMDLRDEWRKLEKRMEAQAASERTRATTDDTFHALERDLRAFKHRLHHQQHTVTHH